MKSSILEQLAQTAFLPEVERAVYRNNLYEYIKAAWPVIEPAPFLPNWHIELIAEYLEAVTYGDIKRLLINLPPRYMKSTCVSILWPTWSGPEARSKANHTSLLLKVRARAGCSSAMPMTWQRRSPRSADVS